MQGAVAAAVEAFVANGQVGQAVAILTASDGAPTCTYHLLVKACGELKDADTALQVYTCMEERNVMANHACFCTLIDLCAREGRMERAGALFRAMYAAGLSPELATYQTIVKGHCVRGDLDSALKEEAELHRLESQRLNEELYLQEKRQCDWYVEKHTLQQQMGGMQQELAQRDELDGEIESKMAALFSRMKRLEDENIQLAETNEVLRNNTGANEAAANEAAASTEASAGAEPVR